MIKLQESKVIKNMSLWNHDILVKSRNFPILLRSMDGKIAEKRWIPQMIFENFMHKYTIF
jgi:hypothetical protein